MIRVDANKAMEALIAKKPKPGLQIILSDEKVLRKLAAEKIEKLEGALPVVYSGKTATLDLVEALASQGMFSPPRSAIVELGGDGQKVTAKQWESYVQPLLRLPTPLQDYLAGNLGLQIFLFSSPVNRTVIKETHLPGIPEAWLCYAPNERIACLCAELLMTRFATLSQRTHQEISQLAAQAVEYYALDLLAVDAHFERMDKAGLRFEDALAGQGDVGAFHVVDAVAKRDATLTELRLQQCEAAGEDAGGVLMALLYFLKQVVAVQAAMQQGTPLKSALENLHIPFPSHDRVNRGVKNFNAEKLAHFFFRAAETEMNLRTQKSPYTWLAVELHDLIK